MSAGRREAKVEALTENRGRDRRAVRRRCEVVEPGIGVLVFAEGEDMAGRRCLRPAPQAVIGGDVAVDDGDAAANQPREDLALGVGDLGHGGEIFEVNGRHVRNDGDLRVDLGHQRLDLARVVHADLEDAELASVGMRARVRGTPQ